MIFLQDLGGVIVVRGQQALFSVERHVTDIYAWALTATNVAWSLGVELTFYLLAPYLLKGTNWQLFGLAVIGALFKIAAILGIHNDLPYRMFPFVFVNFMAGVLAYRMRGAIVTSLGKYTPWIAYSSMIGIITSLPMGWADWQHSVVVIAVTAFVVPILFYQSKANALDNQIGELSYPLYLFHIPAISIVHAVVTKRLGVENSYAVSACVLVTTLILSYFVLRLETKYVEPYRQRLGRPAHVPA